MKTNIFPISKYAVKYIVTSFVLFTLFWIIDFDFFAFISFSAIFVFAYLYRNPERELAIFETNSVVSPVDGVVNFIEELEDDEYAYKIEIEGSYLEVGILRAPMDGVVEKALLQKGARLPKSSLLCSAINENAELVFRSSASNSIKVKHFLKESFTSLDIDTKKGDKLRQSSRYGSMINGHTNIYIPQNFRLSINVGHKVTASQTLLGYFISLP